MGSVARATEDEMLAPRMDVNTLTEKCVSTYLGIGSDCRVGNAR